MFLNDSRLQCNIRQSCHLDDPAYKVQASGNENVDGPLLSVDGVNGVLDGREDMNVVFLERGHELVPCIRELVLYFEMEQLALRNGARVEICHGHFRTHRKWNS